MEMKLKVAKAMSGLVLTIGNHDRVGHTLISYLVSSYCLAVGNKVEKCGSFHWGVYCVCLFKIKFWKYFINISRLSELNSMICSVLFEFQAQLKAYKAYVYHEKCSCKIRFSTFDDSAPFWSYYLKIIHKHNYHRTIETCFWYKDAVVGVYLSRAKFL